MHDSTLNNCQTCGAPLDPDNPQPLCPGCVFAEAMAPTPDSPAPGTIGGHLILEEIARGGMGVVYLAKQKDPDRLVALKTLRATALGSPEALRRFRQEARAMAALDHPAILPVYQFGEQDGVPFFTMKLATGGTLEKRHPRFAGQWRDIAELMATVADAVQHAHSHTLLHRDLKPANILFDEEDRPYVADFGIAKLLDDGDTENALTRTSAVLGTPNYLSPEVASKDARNATTASDVWSLGVILYELLAQKRPFDGLFIPEVLTAILTKEPAAIPGAPRDLSVIAFKALSKEPHRRYATARDMAEDLRSWLAGRPIAARATTTIERMNLWAKRSPALAGLSLLALIAALTAVGSLWWVMHTSQREAEIVRTANIESQKNLRQSLLEQARAGRTANLAGWRAKGLEAIRQAAAIQPGPDLRDEAIAHLAGYDIVESPARGNSATPPAMSASTVRNIRAVSEDDSTVAFYRQGVSAKIGTLTNLPGGANSTYAVSADSKWVVQFGNAFGTRLFDSEAVTKAGEWPGHVFLGFNDTGTALLLAEQTRQANARDTAIKGLRALSLATRQDLPGLPGKLIGLPNSADNNFCLAPDDSTLLALSTSFLGTSYVQIWNWADYSRGMLRQFSIDSSAVCLRWKKDWLAIGTSSGSVYLYRHLQRKVFPLVYHQNPIHSLEISDDGLFLTSTDKANSLAVWQTDTRAQIARFVGHRLSNQQVFMNSWKDFRENSYGRNTQLSFSPSPILRLISERRSLDSAGRLDFSPDGRWLCSTGDIRIALYEVSSGKLAAIMPVQSAHCALFTADSRRLLLQEKNRITPVRLSLDGNHLNLSREKELLATSSPFYSYMGISDNRRWLTVPESPSAIRLLDCSSLETKPDWKTIPVSNGANVTFASSDGHWLVAGSRSSKGPPRYWDLTKPESESHILHPGTSSPKFSPDSKWLSDKDISAGDLVFYDTATWREVHRGNSIKDKEWSGSIDWSDDSRLLAVSMSNQKIKIIEAGTWKTFAYITAPIERTSQVLFTPDCRQLAVRQEEGGVILWNLGKLAEELRQLGLNLDLPPPMPTPPVPPELSGPVEEANPEVTRLEK